jgi:hypothetical protein
MLKNGQYCVMGHASEAGSAGDGQYLPGSHETQTEAHAAAYVPCGQMLMAVKPDVLQM